MAEAPSVVVAGHLEPGLIVAKNYRVVRSLAEGGFGTVYLGENTTLEQQVVIKVLREGERGAGAEEARMLAALDHPNVVHVYAYDDAHDCIVMQHLAGKTLFESRGELDVVASVRVVYEIALALKAVHERGLVHRDVKPENIMLGHSRAWVKLIDMGTALRIGRTLTASAGTPEFCPPEQFDGSIGASPANDIYSLGVTLFSLCAGALPYEGGVVQLRDAHVGAPIPDLVEVVNARRAAAGQALDPRLEFLLQKLGELTAKMMSKSMRLRPDAREVASVLDALQGSFSREATFVGGMPLAPLMVKTTTGMLGKAAPTMVIAPAASTTQQAIDAARGPRRWPMVAAALALLLLLGLGLGWSLNRPPELSPAQTAVAVVPAPAAEPVIERAEELAPLPNPPAPQPSPTPSVETAPAAPPMVASAKRAPPASIAVPTPVAIKKPGVRVEARAACTFDDRFLQYVRGTATDLRSMNRQHSPEFDRLDDALGDALVEKDCHRANIALNQLRRFVGVPTEED